MTFIKDKLAFRFMLFLFSYLSIKKQLWI